MIKYDQIIFFSEQIHPSWSSAIFEAIVHQTWFAGKIHLMTSTIFPGKSIHLWLWWSRLMEVSLKFPYQIIHLKMDYPFNTQPFWGPFPSPSHHHFYRWNSINHQKWGLWHCLNQKIPGNSHEKWMVSWDPTFSATKAFTRTPIKDLPAPRCAPRCGSPPLMCPMVPWRLQWFGKYIDRIDACVYIYIHIR